MRKMKSKLYFQISMIIIPLMLLTAAVISYVVYNSTLKGFLEAQKEYMKANADTAYNELFGNSTIDLELAKSYIERHPDEKLDSQLTDEEIEQHSKNDRVQRER